MESSASQRAHELITQSHRILGVTHISPDGDAIGSLLGMRKMLQAMGKTDLTFACDDRVPEKLRFLPGSDDVIDTLYQNSTDVRYDLILILDCSDDRRGGQVFEGAQDSRTAIINIDHHITNTYYGDVNIVKPELVATTQVLFNLANEWNIALDADLALCLLTGLVTDTLSFRTANVTPEVMSVASELMNAGADLALVTGQTVNRERFNAIRYWGLLLSSLQLDDRVISVQSTLADRRRGGFDANGDASIVTFLIKAWEADIAASFVETEQGRIEVSFRAKPGFDVSGIALSLGGGGHPAAAGCTVEGPFDKTVTRVIDMLKKARREQVSRPAGQNLGLLV